MIHPDPRFVRPELQCRQVTLAEEQPEYMPVTVGLLRHPNFPGEWNTIMLALRFDKAQREAIYSGEDVFIGVLTFGKTMQPLEVSIGKDTVAAKYNVPVE